MAATLLQLRDLVKLDAGIEGMPKWADLRITKEINLAQRYVQTELNGLGMAKWESSISIGTPSAGTYSGVNIKTVAVTTLTNMLESPNSIMQIETTSVSTDGIAREVDKQEFEELISNTYTAPTLEEPIFMRLSGNIYISPSTVTGGTAHYYKGVTDLSSDSDTTEIPVEFEEFIVKKAVLEIDVANDKLQDKELALRQLNSDINSAYDKFLSKQNEQFKVKKREKVKLS